jgi:hypothetical protein
MTMIHALDEYATQRKAHAANPRSSEIRISAGTSELQVLFLQVVTKPAEELPP